MTQKEKRHDISIESEMKKSYLEYAMSVIIGRALPDVRDGLKPVHRRVLYAMRELKNDWNKPYKKSARIVGDVIGKYHPHGDTAVYDTIVRMAQDFSLRYPFVDGQGNFGSVDGDSPAAMRYTEIRMMRLSNHMMEDLDKETVDFTPNYDESLEEPSVLPAKLPALLTATKGLNEPRLPNIMGIMKAKQKPYEEVNAETLGIDNETIGLSGSPTQVRKVFPPEKKKGGIVIDAEDPAAAVKQLVEFLTKKGAL